MGETTCTDEAPKRPRRSGRTPVERFWLKVERGTGDQCWNWLGAKNSYGYGNFWTGTVYTAAHRFSYELEHGSRPDDVLDHLCRNRGCVNPAHLESVTNRENILRGEAPAALNARKAHCPAGHPYDYVRVTRYGSGRDCKTCKREALRRFRARRRQALIAAGR